MSLGCGYEVDGRPNSGDGGERGSRLCARQVGRVIAVFGHDKLGEMVAG
jgi:hypothetical protein